MTSRRTGALTGSRFSCSRPLHSPRISSRLRAFTMVSCALVDPASGAVSRCIRADRIGNGTAAAPQFACEFAFAGEAGEQTIVAWWPGGGPIADGATKIGGVISFKADGLTLTLQGRPGGCQYLMGDDASIDQDLTARHDWRAVRVIRSARLFL